jgi:hypothetical protein
VLQFFGSDQVNGRAGGFHATQEIIAFKITGNTDEGYRSGHTMRVCSLILAKNVKSWQTKDVPGFLR